jgi:hypothetical protein
MVAGMRLTDLIDPGGTPGCPAWFHRLGLY